MKMLFNDWGKSILFVLDQVWEVNVWNNGGEGEPPYDSQGSL